MAQGISDILDNVKQLYVSESALSTLLDFERVLDELDLYVFKNWKNGELVAGPTYEKYFITCTFMWPYKNMPDPRGGQQLLNYNCEVTYKKDLLEFPVTPKSPADFKPGTKLAKTKTTKIWLVTITIPKKLMTEIHQGSIDVENSKLDLSDIAQAYEEGVSDTEDTSSNSIRGTDNDIIDDHMFGEQ